MLALSAGFYLAGWRQIGRHDPSRSILPSWRLWCFFLGLATILVALLSPIGVYDDVFFFMHMIQHLLLMLVAAPLLLLGAPLLPMLWAFPRNVRVGLGRLFAPGPVQSVFTVLTHPAVTVALYCAVEAIWHIPRFYDAAQGRTVVHDLEHAIFLGAALLFWWPVIHPAGGRRRLSYAPGVVYFLPPMLVGTLIGALLTFAERPLYPYYEHVPREWGISVVQDQQLAGLIMWVPGGLVFLVPVFIFLVLLLRESPPDRDGLAESVGGATTPEGLDLTSEPGNEARDQV